MRQIGGERIDDRNRLAPVADTDMNMNPECLNSAGQPLQLLDEFGIALNGRHLCISPVADGMRSGTGQHRTATRGDPLKLRDCRSQVLFGLRDRAADASHDLDSGLH